MYACFVLYVYIIQAHRTRYMSHPSHIAIQICPGIQNNIKIKTIGLPFKNNPRQRKKKTKKKKPVQTWPRVKCVSPQTSARHASSLWLRLCLWVCIRVPHALSAENWRCRVRVVLTILRPCTTGVTERDGEQPGDSGTEVKKWGCIKIQHSKSGAEV